MPQVGQRDFFWLTVGGNSQMADFKPLNIYGQRTYAMKPAAKITTMTGRISSTEITRIRYCEKK
jgi:hypothetical protein